MRHIYVILCVFGFTAMVGCQPASEATKISSSADEATPVALDVEWKVEEEGTSVAAPPGLASWQVSVAEPSAASNVTMGMEVLPDAPTAGNVVTVGVRMRVAKGWHIYAVDKPTDVQTPTTLKLNLPSGFEAVGEWDIPPAKALSATTNGYEKDVIFRHLVRLDPSVTAGEHEMGCQVGYQACSDSTCMQPLKATLTTKVTVSSGN